MKIEHFAINVSDPKALAAWYTENLGLRIIRILDTPNTEHFLADDDGETVLEVYNNLAGDHINFAELHPLGFHIAFSVADMDATRAALIQAGATPFGDVVTTPAGDKLAFLRDPWGVGLQLVQRQKPLI